MTVASKWKPWIGYGIYWIVLAIVSIVGQTQIHQEQLNKELLAAITRADVISMQDLLGKGADPNCSFETWNDISLLVPIRGRLPVPQRGRLAYALSLAATYNNALECQILLDNGADVNQPSACLLDIGGNDQEMRPIEIAIQHRNRELVQLLRAHGAYVEPGFNRLLH